MGLYRVEAIIIKGKDFGEADRILTLYSREAGKFNVIAKGVKKVKSRMRGSVQPFSHSGFILYSGRGNLDTVTQADLLEPFAELRNDLSCWAYANYMAEALEIVPERLAQQELFMLFVTCLHLLTAHEPWVVASLWYIRLLYHLGYDPHLGDCVSCGAHRTGEYYLFSSEQGGVLCGRCTPNRGYPLAHPGTLAVWFYLRDVRLDRLGRLKIGRRERVELGKLLRSYLEYILERPLKSGGFLDLMEE